jgi:hypothetical protein
LVRFHSLWLATVVQIATWSVVTVAPARADELPAQSNDDGDRRSNLQRAIARGRAEQPHWATPMVTNTGRLEERFRFDAAFQSIGNGSRMTVIDGSKGLDLMIGETEEIQIALPPYDIKHTATGKGDAKGLGDWQFLRFKQRLASGNADNGDYIVSALIAFQAPSGKSTLTNDAYQIAPSLALGKGFGAFVVQSTVGFVIPLAHENMLGTQLTTNVALQYHLLRYFWPEIEVNWTYYLDGTRGRKSQVVLTPGLVIGRLPLTRDVSLTVGIAYQRAVAPTYRPSPLLPSFSHAWLASTRLNF